MKRLAVAALALGALAIAYVFLATAGHMTRVPPFHNAYYEQLAVAFADGHVDLVQRPGADLSPESDAFRGRYWDLSLFAGRLYLYWGPAPPLFAALLLRYSAWLVTDAKMTLAFLLLRAVFGALILVRMKRLFFAALPWWPTVLGGLTLAFGAPLTLVYARSAVYEAAIASGQCFLAAATYAAFLAVTRQRDGWTRVLLGVSGVALALAIASRVGQVLTAVVLVALTVAATASSNAAGTGTRRSGRERGAESARASPARGWMGDAAALATPVALTGGLLAVYNRARFGSMFDTGLQHQVSCFVFHNGVRFVLPNIYTYVFRPPLFSASFPFVRVAPWGAFFFPPLMPGLALSSSDVLFEQNAGFLWTTPFYAFAVVAWWSLGRRVVASVRARTVASLAPDGAFVWLTAAALALATLGMIPCLVAFCSATRYLLDATAGLAVSATIGLSLVIARPRRSIAARRAVAACATALVMASLIVNLALWVEGPYGDFLKTENAALYGRLAALFARSAQS